MHIQFGWLCSVPVCHDLVENRGTSDRAVVPEGPRISSRTFNKFEIDAERNRMFGSRWDQIRE